jgi:hypothetical protein
MSILPIVYIYRTFRLNRQDSIKNAKILPYNIRITNEICSELFREKNNKEVFKNYC